MMTLLEMPNIGAWESVGLSFNKSLPSVKSALETAKKAVIKANAALITLRLVKRDEIKKDKELSVNFKKCKAGLVKLIKVRALAAVKVSKAVIIKIDEIEKNEVAKLADEAIKASTKAAIVVQKSSQITAFVGNPFSDDATTKIHKAINIVKHVKIAKKAANKFFKVMITVVNLRLAAFLVKYEFENENGYGKMLDPKIKKSLNKLLVVKKSYKGKEAFCKIFWSLFYISCAADPVINVAKSILKARNRTDISKAALAQNSRILKALNSVYEEDEEDEEWEEEKRGHEAISHV